MMKGKREKALIVLITLLAFGLRVWQLGENPPGWRDDELINSLVISQKALDGDLALYYADASGHEALYHLLNGVMLGLFGANFIGIRLLSAFLGTLAVPATWLLGRRWLGRMPGLLAAAGLSLSFWSLMYSRFGLRHILLPLLTLAAFYWFWRGWEQGQRRGYAAAALFMGLGFYTYFASRGVPLILVAFIGFHVVLTPAGVWRRRLHLAGMFVLTAVAALPLILVLRAQPESEARVAELAVPIIAAREGDFGPLWEYTRVTVSMFHSTGDDEWLYNIPGRPLFAPAAAALFWLGVLLVLGEIGTALRQRWRQWRGGAPPTAPTVRQQAAAFLFLWWLAGISPGFISVPPASLGHTILAMPATYLLLAWPFAAGERLLRERLLRERSGSRRAGFLLAGAGVLLLASIAVRDSSDYFQIWPERGMVRFLYRADIAAVADYVDENRELTDFGIAGLLAGPWDRVALTIDTEGETAVRARWYNPERALLLQPDVSFSGYPQVPAAFENQFTPLSPPVQAGAYLLAETALELPEMEPVCFENGLCADAARFQAQTGELQLGWHVAAPLQLPPLPLISNPPPPGVYNGPRLLVFVQLQDEAGQFLAGDDGLWVDPQTLHPGDRFVQLHRLPPPADLGAAQLAFGLYDPLTGARVRTVGGADQFIWKLETE